MEVSPTGNECAAAFSGNAEGPSECEESAPSHGRDATREDDGGEGANNFSDSPLSSLDMNIAFSAATSYV